jgi:hypothetical protein
LRTEGLAELIRAGDAAGKATKRKVRDALRRAAEPIRDDVRRQLEADHVTSRTVAGVGISVRRTGVVAVEQRRRRTTGRHPEFGSYQMRDAFIPAAESNADGTERRLEQAVDEITDIFERGR